VPNSGLLFVACDAAQLSSYYIPELGPAPKWAGFLDSVTEELADDLKSGAGAYSDFKFVDKAELDTWVDLSHSCIFVLLLAALSWSFLYL
jgi:ribosome biogenesis protein ENP2